MKKTKYLPLIFLCLLIALIYLFSLFKPKIKFERLIRLTDSPASELSPVFSPDGKKIAFTKRYYNETGTFFEIAVMDLETKKINTIFSVSDLQKVCEFGEIKNFSTLEIHRLSWQGNKIIFNTFCTFPITLPLNCTLEPIPEELAKKVHDIGKDKIIKMVMINEDGSNPKIIAPGEHPYFSPDGKKIVYLYKSNFLVSVCGRCGKEIHIMDLENGKDFSVFVQDKTLFWPSFSPDGKWIVFSRIEDEKERRNDIYLIDINGNNLKRLTFSNDNTYPTFTPRGSEIVFVSNKEGKDNLYKVDLKTMKIEKVIDLNATEVANLNFSPDGKKLVFTMLHEKYEQGFDIWMLNLE
jgi:Tol biopolymer transport system component